MPKPCTCPGPNSECRRAGGLPMVGFLWELCSGHGCDAKTSEAYRQIWDNPPGTPRERGPSLLQKAASFAGAVGRHVASGGGQVSETIYEQRRGICNGCERRDVEKDTCLECGCPITAGLLNKLKMPTSECPLGKWGQAEAA